ncbi:alpha/beta fold hydrolase [Paenibacillus thermoaerophilus]|uniref:Alpha/beta fold hydrolase n=1 Tax=Paenibacillus thermoaerophilus TaxID=1215385 RepID=A0ABW2V312_9BACL|nr:alpha/beta hydrolase [Paenibacillus thermoaerophilus]TMV18645.1 alpha/beta fold hydrolase [Paenibacillus thermoaerophilus]
MSEGIHRRTTVLWLTGWSMPDAVFDPLRAALPMYRHAGADYSAADSPEAIVGTARAAARALRSDKDGEAPLLIAGWSLGALLALRLAAEGLADGLVLMAATACFVRPKEQSGLGWPDPYLRKMLARLGKDRERVLEDFRRGLFTDEEREAGCESALLAAAPTGVWTADALAAGLQLLRTEDCRPLLPSIGCPALLIHGTRDTICPYGAALELARLMPRASLIAAEACGHVPFLRREKEIAEAIRSWNKELEA